MEYTDHYASERVRHELVRRTLRVVRTEYVSANLRSITLSGDALRGFVSSGFDDHIKVFLPKAGEPSSTLPKLPELQALADKRFVPEDERPIARDYTPRRYDPVANELDIEFVIHGDGPGSSWAAQAQVGDPLVIGGPRGSFIVSDNFDWYLLVGDETALPAIGRRIETLRESASALVIVSAANPESLPDWARKTHPRANVRVRTVVRSAQTQDTLHEQAGTPVGSLLQAVRDAALPAGTGHAWVAAESTVAKNIRHHLVAERGLDKRHIRAASYWRQGADGAHESLDD